jgi:hypothetical protein
MDGRIVRRGTDLLLMPDMPSNEKLAFYALAIIGLFIIISLLGQILLIMTGDLEGSESSWRPLFDLVAILVGAVAGFIGGRAVGREDQSDDS